MAEKNVYRLGVLVARILNWVRYADRWLQFPTFAGIIDTRLATPM